MKNSNYASRMLLTSAALAIISGVCSAKPAYRAPITVTQPDGSEITIRLVGDERAHLTLTSDNTPLIYDAAKGYTLATIGEDGALISTGIVADNSANRAAATRLSEDQIKSTLAKMAAQSKFSATQNTAPRKVPGSRRGPGLSYTTFPSTGKQKGLVILVNFSDVKFGDNNADNYKYSSLYDIANPAHSYWSNMLNEDNFTGFGWQGSARQWFMTNSTDKNGNAQFEPEFDVYGPVTLPKASTYYGRNSRYEKDMNVAEFVTTACRLLDDDIDFTQYDRDGDGEVDNVYLFYAGFGEADGGNANTIWPHSWELFSAGSLIELDGVTINHYACSNELTYQTKIPDGIGTFVHEFSHVMGLPDLYNTDSSTAYTPGEYSVLDYGPYNNDGFTPPNYSTYERYALGWIEPEQIFEPGGIEVPVLADTNKAYIVKTSKDSEFFLVENRQQKGWDTFLPGHGMLIWHIDVVQSAFDNNTVNNLPSHQYVDLIEANGKQYDYFNAGFPFPGADGVHSYAFIGWNYRDTGISLQDIDEDPTTGKISAYAENENYSAVEDIDIEEAPAEGAVEYYNLQGARIVNPVKGEPIIIVTPTSTQKVIF